MKVKQIAVLGAGVMGAQIAAHFANAGFKTLLYDLAQEGDNPKAAVQKAKAMLLKMKPAPLASPEFIHDIRACDYEHDLPALKNCQVVIEAISERMDWKQALYEMVSPFISANAVLATNSSGLSIEKMQAALPADLQSRFCGMHFFNPPRYMKLVELIPGSKTNPKLLDGLETLLADSLGKQVIRAKDTPNFIANRVGVFSFLSTLHYAEKYKLSPETVDALTGPLLGRAKSATYRTMDVVGLDVLHAVIGTLEVAATDDPWKSHFKLPDWILKIMEGGALGQKTRKGVYEKRKEGLCVFDVTAQNWRPVKAPSNMELIEKLKTMPLSERLSWCQHEQSPEAQFIWKSHQDLFHYCAYHLNDIAETARDVDDAIRWGFGWQLGPFAMWSAIDFTETRNSIQRAIADKQLLSDAPLPAWVDSVSAVYRQGGAYAPSRKDYIPPSRLPVYSKQLLRQLKKAPTTLSETTLTKLWTLKDDVFIFTWNTPRNCVGTEVLEGILSAIEKTEAQGQALVLHPGNGEDFSVGADLKMVSQVLKVKAYDRFESAVKLFQQTTRALKYSSVPTIAALKGMVLGGGCEIALYCDRRVAALESYIGLVESGVGLIPAAGGTALMAYESAQARTPAESMACLTERFKQLAMAKAATSAYEARDMGYLKQSDPIVLQTENLLHAAIENGKAMAQSGYRPPRTQLFRAMGEQGMALLMTLIENMKVGHMVTPHDVTVATHLARVICGGPVSSGTLVSESWLFDLELEAFMALGHEEKTQARIQHTLVNGKPLRN